ncbi:hypothetical protein FANTH_8260 [Fusarium anthophilum]|uniref:Uncharacterized protein n=1 Tax=Fusarium anthophilum TaxID=48485 RepID=A0A8H4ZAV0_9HYPO|nr:hypothetical protein FANTH_8260 [Fusarium anthophilum]
MQAATCTSMLAAILLQNGAVPLACSAAVSIIRCHNSGPWSLYKKTTTDWHYGPLSVGLLTKLLTFTTLFLQFTTTILLSEVGIHSLPVATSVPRTYYGTDPRGPSFLSQELAPKPFYQATPERYPAFAEWVSNATNTSADHGEFAPYNSPGIRDTGTVVRAFLPFKDDERRSLIGYQGYATALDTRVVCTRPIIKNVTFSSVNGYRVAGLADVKQKPSGFRRHRFDPQNQNHTMSFDCTLVAVTSANYSQTTTWPLTLCKPISEHSKQGIYSVMQPEGQEELGNSYLLLNATMANAVTGLDTSDVWTSIILKDKYIYNGTAQGRNSNSSVVIQFTLCMTAFEGQEMEVDVMRPETFSPEPLMRWNTSSASYDIREVQNQLGVGLPRNSTANRGIFDLKPRSWKWPKRPKFLNLTGGAFSTTDALEGVGDKDTYNAIANNAQYSTLAYITAYTEDPALALQAYFTTLCAICYYDRIIMFDRAGPSSQISLVQAIRPLGSTAAITVAIIAMLHILLVIVITMIFRRTGGFSRIGNAWTSVSQLLGPHTDGWIKDADTADDKAVKSWLKDRGMDETSVQINLFENRVQLIKKEKD